MGPIDKKACFGEFIAMMFFVYVGCGAATSNAGDAGWVLLVSLQFGIAIMVLAYATAHISGAQINCAVTLALCITGNVTWTQGFANLGSQLLGSILGASLLLITASGTSDNTSSLGSNDISATSSVGGAFVAEAVMTGLLVFVVLQTACCKNSITSNNANNPKEVISVAPIAIGFAVFLAHTILIPIDGCSINPTRSFGPAVVASINGTKVNVWADMWVFWLGPCVGASVVAVVNILCEKALPKEDAQAALVSGSGVPADDVEMGAEKPAPAPAPAPAPVATPAEAEAEAEAPAPAPAV